MLTHGNIISNTAAFLKMTEVNKLLKRKFKLDCHIFLDFDLLAFHAFNISDPHPKPYEP